MSGSIFGMPPARAGGIAHFEVELGSQRPHVRLRQYRPQGSCGPSLIEASPGSPPEQLLERFGLESFRPGQREAVQAALEGRDSLVVMPTGGGKSLCYQLPALAGEALVVVVSPLIALMADQLGRLQQAGVNAAMLASGMAEGHNAQALRSISSGEARLVLAAPERFASRAFRETLATREVGLFVVDEAHCVAEWGHDFRPDYLRLHDAIEALGRPAVMATTATATPRVAEEIAARLGLRDWLAVRSGFDRPNLTFDVVALEGKGAVARKRATLLYALERDGCATGDRVLRHTQGHRRGHRATARARARRRLLPRRHVSRCAALKPGGVHERGCGGCGCHQRVWHGRRQG